MQSIQGSLLFGVMQISMGIHSLKGTLSVFFLICIAQLAFARQWNALGPGLNDPQCVTVHEILIDGTDLHAVGGIRDAGFDVGYILLTLWP